MQLTTSTHRSTVASSQPAPVAAHALPSCRSSARRAARRPRVSLPSPAKLRTHAPVASLNHRRKNLLDHRRLLSRRPRAQRSAPSLAPSRSALPTGTCRAPRKRNPGARATGPRVCAASAGLPLRWRTSEHITPPCDACCCERLRWLLTPPFLNPKAPSPRLVIVLGLMRRRASDSESADTRLQSRRLLMVVLVWRGTRLCK